MARMERLLAPAIIALVLAAGLAGLGAWNSTSQPEAQPGIQIIPILRVYKNGEMVYEKVGDPPTSNLALLFLSTIAPAQKSDGSTTTLTITAMDGSAKSLNPNNAYVVSKHSLWAIVGTGTNPPSASDYTVQLVAYGEAKLVSLWYDENQTAWHMLVSAGVTLNAGANISEVGLAADVLASNLENPDSTPTYNLLVFRDLLPQPISAGAGDVIEVQYEIIIDLP